MDNVVYLYLKWFDELHNVWESTVSDAKGWHRLDDLYERTILSYMMLEHMMKYIMIH